MKNSLLKLIGIVFFSVAMISPFCVQAKESLIIYTATGPEWLPKYKKAFEQRFPDVEFSFVRAGAGTISARLIAEKKNPKADVVFAVSAIAMENLRQQGVIDRYIPKGLENINPKMRSPQSYWFGISAWSGSLCVNTELLAKNGLPVPTSWQDLLDPKYKGMIVMPSPVASSTGYMFLLGWLQQMGEVDGWKYIRALHQNILFYIPSGDGPAAMVAQGEVAIGLSSEVSIAPFLKYHIPVITVAPQEGIAWDSEANALVKGTKNPKLAREFLDFCSGEEVAKIASEFGGIAGYEKFSTTKGRELSSRFLPLDFSVAAANKQSVLKHWTEMVNE